MEQALDSEALRLYPLLIAKDYVDCFSCLWVGLVPKTKASAPNSSAWTWGHTSIDLFPQMLSFAWSHRSARLG